jgi:hypothetical protein
MNVLALPPGRPDGVGDGEGEPDTDGDAELGGVEDPVVGLALRRTTTMRPHIPQFGYAASLPWMRQ